MGSKERDIAGAGTVASLPLWFGILAGPLIWSVQLVLNVGLPDAVVCAPGSRQNSMLWGLGVQTVIQITNSVATVVTVLALVVSYRCYRRLRIADETAGGRGRWMAVAGMFNSSLFLILVALKFASPFYLGSCGPSP